MKCIFSRRLKPALDGHSGRFLGRLDMHSKRRFLSASRRFLSASRCLLVPSLVPETSSLVAMEAFASGTPVVAFPSGALAEIVEHGKTGYLVKDEDEMAVAIQGVDAIKPSDCGSAAEGRFSADRMFTQYLKTYCSLASRHPTRAARSVETKVLREPDVLAGIEPEWHLAVRAMSWSVTL